MPAPPSVIFVTLSALSLFAALAWVFAIAIGGTA